MTNSGSANDDVNIEAGGLLSAHDVLDRKIEILAGLLVALDNWAEVGRLVTSANDQRQAVERLAQSDLGLTETQAQFVLDLNVARLMRQPREELQDELARLKKERR
jgi:DNA gyrase/topoisomerase IV subunit A